jgi:hypothetical protein
MSKKNILIGTLTILTLFIFFTQKNKRNINWFPSYYYKHKIPFGTYIFYDLARKKIIPPITKSDKSPYLLFKDNKDRNATYVLYNSIVNLGETNLQSLLAWVNRGNRVFIFSKKFEQPLLDSLHLSLENVIEFDNAHILPINFIDSTLHLNQNVVFDRPNISHSVLKTDSIKDKKSFSILGTLQDSLVNFARFSYGKGDIYLHTMPQVLTNYFVLSEDNIYYNKGILSYINRGDKIYWDINYQNGSGNSGIFRVLRNTPAFIWTYRLLFIGVLLFLFFEGKRKQRPIPIIKPPVNESLNFTETLAYMFINNKEHKEMANKQIKLFMDWLKNSLYLDISKPIDELIKEISKRTKKISEEEIKEVFLTINQIQNKNKIQAKDVMFLESLIKKIKNGI